MFNSECWFLDCLSIISQFSAFKGNPLLWWFITGQQYTAVGLCKHLIGGNIIYNIFRPLDWIKFAVTVWFPTTNPFRLDLLYRVFTFYTIMAQYISWPWSKYFPFTWHFCSGNLSMTLSSLLMWYGVKYFYKCSNALCSHTCALRSARAQYCSLHTIIERN